jgi:PAS domain S-box-containing protein
MIKRAACASVLLCLLAGTASNRASGDDGEGHNVELSREATTASGPATLPAGSNVGGRQPVPWYHYASPLAGLAALCAVQALLIGGLAVHHWRRTRTAAWLRQAADGAPIGMLLVAADGKIGYCNKQWEMLFGYARGELVGQRFDVLLPERDRSMHRGLRHGLFAHPEALPLSAGRQQFGLRKDGSEFPVEIGRSPLQSLQGRVVLASVVDTSERSRVESELRDSREELRQLAAQILGAQEMERRRIARELHDDFGQDLALISVELDLYRQRPPVSRAEAEIRMEALATRVKQLSSSIHELSHQLHPMKLEQLGLVAAIRGLCKELSQSHSVRIAFSHEEVPAMLLPSVALCLYRVGQEALRNVVKHSGASSATVTLVGCLDSISLEVCDMGNGFDSALVAGQGGLGLVSMRERLRLVEGELTIDSRPAAGTRLEARVPLFTPQVTRMEPVLSAASC